MALLVRAPVLDVARVRGALAPGEGLTMGHQIIKQPDGKLAVFSNGVDAWIITDASPAWLEEYYVEAAAQAARLSARETMEKVLAGRSSEVYCQFTMTFSEANNESREGGGDYWADGEWVSQSPKPG